MNEITILTERFVELLKREEELKLLKKAIFNLPYNSQVENIKDIFDIKEPVSEGDKTDE